MNLKEIGEKRQKKWKETDLYKVKEDISKPKFYVLDMFPYPSGAALHVWHPKWYIASDCLARKKMLQGFNVLHPMGFDTFGLGTEQYAIDHKMKPQDVAKENVDTFIQQLKMFGMSYDRSRSVNTADPKYFKRTQRIFLQMYNHYYDEKLKKAMPITDPSKQARLAYVDYKPINRCPHCMTGLANEDLDDGKCERCGSEVEQKPMKQRVLRITKYAERLLEWLEKVNWEESMKDLERNWIGKSEWTEFKMKIVWEEKDKAAYLVIEKSIKSEAMDELLSFGKWNIETVSSERGNFYRIFVDKKNEEKFIAFLSKSLKTKDGTWEINWYADSDGTTNKVIFSGGKVFDTSTEEWCKEATKHWISLGIPDYQVNFTPRKWSPGYKDNGKSFSVYTTRIDTVFWMSFVAIAPEHPLVEKITTKEFIKDVEKYKDSAKKKSQLERTELQKEKTGVFCWAYAINPFTNEKVPVFVADYVLANYWTWVVMAVPAHDERDFEFAKKYNLPIKKVVEPFVYYADGDSAVREWSPFVERENVCIILRDPKTDSYLCTDWKDHNMHGLITWWIDEGEDIVEAAKRELYEESGYKNVKYIKDPDFAIHTFFWHRVKKSNRHARFSYLMFELVTDERDEIAPEEAAVHHLVWKTKKELETFFTVAEWSFALNFLDNDNYIFTDNGILHDSGEFTGMKSEEAIPAMQQRLEKNKKWWVKVNYKMQDRVFSRQRYRGEPFPILWTEDEPKISLSFYEQKTWKAIVDGVKTLETRALNPEEPERFFGNIQVGDVVKFINKETWASIFVKITQTYQRKNLEDLWNTDRTIIEKIYTNKKKIAGIKTLEQFSIGRDFQAWYLDKINTNGLVWREFEIIEPVKKILPLDEKDLPLLLPDVENYEPTGTEEWPLANITDWVNVTLPDGTKAKRETNTMPGRAGSSRYWLRYMDVNNENALVGKDKEAYRGNVDVYIGGAEHITRHMIYGRFWQKFLFDLWVVTQDEPFQEYHYVGLIMGEDGRKMSKRRWNVVNPNDIVNQYWSDALRVYEMFMGPFDQSIAWNTSGISGTKKFLDKVQNLSLKVQSPSSLKSKTKVGDMKTWWPEDLMTSWTQDEQDKKTIILLNQTIKKVGENIDEFKFNTAISQLMILTNHLTDIWTISRTTLETLVILLSPFAPHLAEELWEQLGNAYSIFTKATRPKYDETLLVADTITIAVQVNGKVRGTISLSLEADEQEAMTAAKADEKINNRITSEPKKIIYVKGKILNIVV